MQAVEARVDKDAIMYADAFLSCEGLAEWGWRCHYGVRHGDDEFVQSGERRNRIEGIESFRGYAKNRLVKYQGSRPGRLLPPPEGMRVRIRHARPEHAWIHAQETPHKTTQPVETLATQTPTHPLTPDPAPACHTQQTTRHADRTPAHPNRNTTRTPHPDKPKTPTNGNVRGTTVSHASCCGPHACMRR